MSLQEKHKQFAVKSYAKFRTNKQVAQASDPLLPLRRGEVPSPAYYPKRAGKPRPYDGKPPLLLS